jgi:RimJ/RimL family protein N-acetyltransferase
MPLVDLQSDHVNSLATPARRELHAGHEADASANAGRARLIEPGDCVVIGERKVWGTGIATRAWCGVLDHLLAAGGLRKITAGTMAANVPMLKLIERSGMVLEGRKQRQFLLDGAAVDLMFAAKFV